MKVFVYILLAFFAALPAVTARACTSFFLGHDQNPVHGANLDWTNGAGIIVVNKKGVFKTAVSGSGEKQNPAKWTSRYGSVSFNMFGCDWAWGGMNEAGLAASTMIMDETQYPKADARPSVFLGQWLQYQLDNSAAVEDVLSSNDNLRIRPTGQDLKTHYFFSDRSGNCAVVEFLKGRFVAYHQDKIPVKALVNERYEVSLSNWEKFRPLVGKTPRFNGDLSYKRFIRIAGVLEQWRPGENTSAVENAFTMLDNVSYRWHRTMHTQWRIVFDSQNRIIHYQTRKDMRIKRIDLEKLDFSCRSPIVHRDVDAFTNEIGMEGFSPLTRDVNFEMNKRAFVLNPLKPESSSRRLERLARYPETFICR